jgi:5-methylcytosine-specific restriction endonuclease McrA
MGSGVVTIATTDPRGTRAWRALKDRVVAEEPDCRLGLPGCTFVSTTADHVLTVTDRPDLALARANLRGACESCNEKRGHLDDDALVLGTASRPRALDIFR